MPARGERESPVQSPEPPEWWDISLYSFITSAFPLERWVWEFMRRDRLREVLGGRPVDAMNPNPDLDSIEDTHYWNYYKPANHPRWEAIGKAPYFLPPAVNTPGHWPIRFEGQQYRLEDDELRNYNKVNLNIDFNRRNDVIIRDFKYNLDLLRNEFPKPPPIRPKPENWFDNRILQVWDLREFDVSWRRIAALLGFGSPPHNSKYAKQKPRNSFNTAETYIDNKKYKDLARWIEL